MSRRCHGLGFRELNHAPLLESGYSHTVVAAHRVFVYNVVGAAVEVLWSRRRPAGSELQCWAAHFGVAKTSDGWRVGGIQSTATTSDSLDAMWPGTTDALEASHG